MSSFLKENPKICCSPCGGDIWAFHLDSRVAHLLKINKPIIHRISKEKNNTKQVKQMQIDLLKFGRSLEKAPKNINCSVHLRMDKL